MTEEQQLRHRIDELSATCAALEDERSAAEAPVRAHFAPELAALNGEVKQLTHTLAQQNQVIALHTQQREAFERARLFAVWQSARSVGTWVVVLSATAGLAQSAHPWAAVVPVALAAAVSKVFRGIARRSS